MRRIRWLLLTIAALGILGAGLVARFPTQAACRASGRIVDPTERHCVAADGYVQLREHVLFHAGQVVTVTAGAAALGVLGLWAVRRRARRRAARRLTT